MNPTTPPNLETSEDRKAWMLTHHAQDEIKWHTQDETNRDVEKRLRKMEARIVILSTASACAGAGGGAFVAKLLGY